MTNRRLTGEFRNRNPTASNRTQFSARLQMAEEILRGNGLDDIRANSEHRLITRLTKTQQWVVPERILESGPEVLAVIAEDDMAETKERIASLRTLVMMKNANTGEVGMEVRINQAIAIEVTPAIPVDVNQDAVSFIEDVNSDNLDATAGVLHDMGQMTRYLDQVIESDKRSGKPSSNGKGKH